MQPVAALKKPGVPYELLHHASRKPRRSRHKKVLPKKAAGPNRISNKNDADDL